MGANPSEISRQFSALRPIAQTSNCRDYNELTRLFMREISQRTRAGSAPDCLFIDLEESGQPVWAGSSLGPQSRSIQRGDCPCFNQPNQACAGASSGLPVSSCPLFNDAEPLAPGEASVTGTAPGQFDLVISCHSLSFLSHPRATCFLKRLLAAVRSGGMLFISALGRYSALADAYPAGDLPLASRFYPLAPSRGLALPEGTHVCLYSERDLCNTLFAAGWSVIRSSTSTENNVLATAIRP